MGTYLISKTDFAPYRQITGHLSNSYDARVKPYVLEAQELDLRAILSKPFYDQIIQVAETGAGVVESDSSLSKDHFDELLEYIKPVLVHYAWSRLLRDNQNTVTVNSVVRKKTEFSEPTQEKELTRLVTSSQSKAKAYTGFMTDFIEENINNYLAYRNNLTQIDTKKGSIRISSIDNTYYNQYHNGKNRYGKDYSC